VSVALENMTARFTVRDPKDTVPASAFPYLMLSEMVVVRGTLHHYLDALFPFTPDVLMCLLAQLSNHLFHVPRSSFPVYPSCCLIKTTLCL
jgi:hypothetical protein